MRKLLITISGLAALMALSAMPVLAQTDDIQADATAEPTLIMAEDGPADDAADVTASEDGAVLEGIDAEEFTADNVPTGGFSLWWRGLVEDVSLAFTFNPVTKAEKRITFAEERLSMAEAMLDKAGDDPALQEKAQEMIERAQGFMNKVEEKKDKWIEKEGELRDRLMNNVGAHLLRREEMMNRIQENLPEDAADQFEALQEQGQAAATRLMNALENDDIPERVREHLSDVKDRIEMHAEMLREMRNERLELRDRIREGDEGAVEELQQLRENQREEMKGAMEERREEMKDAAEQRREAWKQQNEVNGDDADSEEGWSNGEGDADRSATEDEGDNEGEGADVPLLQLDPNALDLGLSE